MASIPRGVVDERGRQAVVHDHEGALMALDLESGALLWRHGPGMRPCALHAGSVVALRIGAAPELVVVVLDAGSGADRWEAEPVALPSWARCTLDDTREFALSAEPVGDAVVLRWVARSWYGGGAAPSARVLEESRREAHGALRVDPARAGRVEVLPVPAEADVPPPVPPEAPPHPPHPSYPPYQQPPDVVDQSVVGDLRLELARRADSGAVVLRAVDPRTGTRAWEVELDRTTPQRAPRLPP
ncbi:hypothetical protein [Streptomyces sp. NPDC048623]|uniref:hypothetical protein n=1 Tax=Streptomyces sp. NPDC048623 TaxID=3155761 RepID=UPI00341538C2